MQTLGTRKSLHLRLFLVLFVTYAFFHQGGGWNQNSRFDQVRALVDSGSLEINAYCSYELRELEEGRLDLRRLPMPNPLPQGYPLDSVNGLDIAIYEGKIYPNKPPGTTFLALPAYTLARGLLTLLGRHPDGWWGLTFAFYLTTIFTVGLLGALGGVVFLATSQRLFPNVEDRWHLLATLGFTLSTPYFPFATMLFDHIPAAVLALLGFYLLLPTAPEAPSRIQPRIRLLLAGTFMACGVLVNYTVVLILLLTLPWLFHHLEERQDLLFFLLGGGIPAAALTTYHRLAFDNALTIANTHQSELFMKGEEFFLGVFGLPDLHALMEILWLPKRGLFFFAPLLLLAVLGFVPMLRRGKQRPEALLFLAIAAAFLTMNASFVDWDGGNSFGPRYLLPALPFLALPLAPAMARRPRLAMVLLVLSFAVALLGTATDPQVHNHFERPLGGHALEIFLGREIPLSPPDLRDPVARNPAGVYEPYAYEVFPPGSPPTQWNSFNLGEWLFPQSRWSLLPLLLFLGFAVWHLLATCRENRLVTE